MVTTLGDTNMSEPEESYEPTCLADPVELYEVFKRTTEDWHPPYVAGNHRLVKVQLYKPVTEPRDVPRWIINVWGADDFGMTAVFYRYTRDEAYNKFLYILMQDNITRRFLESLGFTVA